MSEQRVVLADTDPGCRRNLKALLQKAGYLVVGEAEDGLSALKLIRNRQPDLIIIEDRLSIMDGDGVADIVQEEALAPIILMTGRDGRGFIGHQTTGDFAYVIKPVSEHNLFPVIDLVMRNYQKVRQLEDEIVKLKETLETRKLVEKAKGILMDTLGVKEGEAFKRIQKQSMNKRMSMKAVAKAIILANELRA